MTVTYLQHVQTSTTGGFLRLLLIWKGSVVKGIWKNLAAFLVLWYLIHVVYNFILVKDEYQDLKGTFEVICLFFEANEDNIPLAFILGFYVTQIGKYSGNIYRTVKVLTRHIYFSSEMVGDVQFYPLGRQAQPQPGVLPARGGRGQAGQALHREAGQPVRRDVPPEDQHRGGQEVPQLRPHGGGWAHD